jgi:hypothetical protein
MTASDKGGPLAPRRPLAKQAGGPPRPGQRGPGRPGTATASSDGSSSVDAAPMPDSDTRPSFDSDSRPNFDGKRPASGANGATGQFGGPSGETEQQRPGSPPGMAPQAAAPRPSPAPEPSGPSYPLYEPRSAVDVETQPAIPVPPGLAPVPPAPPGPQVDKRAERAAAKAQRRLESSKPRTIRRAKLRIVRVDPWSITKTAFLLSIAFGIMCVVAVFLIFSIMSASGLWDSVNSTIQGVVDQRPSEAFDIKDYVGMSRVMGITMLVAAIDVVIITALATLGAFIYNMSASLLGGVEVTLAEDLH